MLRKVSINICWTSESTDHYLILHAMAHLPGLGPRDMQQRFAEGINNKKSDQNMFIVDRQFIL